MHRTTWFGAVAVTAVLLTLLPGAEARARKKKKRARHPAAMSFDRTLHSATTLDDGDVLVVGGMQFGASIDFIGTVAKAERYDHKTRTWKSAGVGEARVRHTATLLDDGRVLLAGGQVFDAKVGNWRLAVDELWDAGTFTAAGHLLEQRTDHTAVRLDDGRVLLAGGSDMNGATIDGAELWDPATGAWEHAGALNAARLYHAMVALPGGAAAVIGGVGAPKIERWDPATRAWTIVAELTQDRASHTATLLPDGQLLVVGGDDGFTFTATAELCDLAAGTCTPTGSLATARSGHEAVLLPGGEVAVIGGEGGSVSQPSQIADVEVWDPSSGTWRTTATLTRARHEHGANLLDDGKILVTGGSGCGRGCENSLDDVELLPP